MPTIALAGNLKVGLFCWPAESLWSRLPLLCPTDNLSFGEKKRSQSDFQALKRSRTQNVRFTEPLTRCSKANPFTLPSNAYRLSTRDL